ncbi:MAG: hypothetical protein KA206_11495 [Paludibacter sp.]|nr:hypothetical protein [Paludibacter sp.]
MSQLSLEFKVSIADVVIRLFSTSEIELEEGYVPFLADEDAVVDIQAECFVGLPELNFDALKLLFEARNDEQRFYSIYDAPEGYCFVVYDQQEKDEVQQIAFLTAEFDYWKIYSRNAMALKYPMGPIIMHYLTLYTDAVLMHASCVFDGSEARMFSGFSGVGKSTISGIWAKAGAQMINDDRLVIRKKGNEFWVYNTPMYYVDDSKKAILSSIYLIKHSPENVLKKLSGALAVSRVMAFCIQNNFDRAFIDRRLKFFSELSNALPIAELGFVPTNEVIAFIKQNETSMLK